MLLLLKVHLPCCTYMLFAFFNSTYWMVSRPCVFSCDLQACSTVETEDDDRRCLLMICCFIFCFCSRVKNEANRSRKEENETWEICGKTKDWIITFDVVLMCVVLEVSLTTKNNTEKEKLNFDNFTHLFLTDVTLKWLFSIWQFHSSTQCSRHVVLILCRKCVIILGRRRWGD